ncbi:SDR family oxidoreductase [Thiomonas delicata]|uniref:Short-chain dehydrogenase/reductase SDR n=1 Tax=Thiomonas delicata TaxID=364030 RepID=A0A238D307_THIDL|nr:SDR family oxidoreductase [Thiomonas delicata]SBP87570.1 Short-chain dehydrogenase/reductase SDR [Thiomonas delicata]
MPTTDKRVALVTGANKGIGNEVARELAQRGLTVLLGARDAALGEAAAAALQSLGLDARFIEIDLGGPSTLTAAAERIDAEFARLDVLVNNAGISDARDAAPSEASIEAVRRIFDTNFFGTLAVTQAMLPLLRRSSAGRIVNVSSELGSLTMNSDPQWKYAAYKFLGYSASKAALNMLTVQLAAELQEAGIKVNAVNPGFTATDLNHHQGTQTLAEGAAAALHYALIGNDGASGGFFSADAPLAW